MKKILAMFVCLLAFSVASAQNKTTTNSTTSDSQDKAAMKNKSDMNSDMNSSADKKKRKSKKMSAETNTSTNTHERANGTTGVQEYPDTQGAGTGTGNDSRKTPPPGQPENTAK